MSVTPRIGGKHIAQHSRPIAALAGTACLLLAAGGCADDPLRPSVPASEPPRASLVLRPDGLSCTEPDARLGSGAPFQVCVLAGNWNGDVVVFIPGYHDPARAPSLPDVFGETPAVTLFSQLGYAFATTGFRGTGLIDPDTWIGGDLLELVNSAKTLLTNTTGRTTRFVYQTGGSQGGLGTVMAVERYPGTFHGGLAACGPIGDYRRQIQYVGDFRVTFDYLFAPVSSGWPVWKQDLAAGDPGYVDPATWATAQPLAEAAINDPANADRVQQLLQVTRAPIDAADPRTIRGTTVGVLWYSFRGSNDAIGKLSGSPFDNRTRVYAGSSNDAALNAGVQRFAFTADPAKVAKLQTSARLFRPLVTMHTSGDPIVPVWHQSVYRGRLGFFSRLFHTPWTIQRYGHCNFTDTEILAGFSLLVLKVSGVDLLVTSRVLPGPEAQAEFLRMSRDLGAHPIVVR